MTASKSPPARPSLDPLPVTQARRVIHDNDVERLKQLLVDYPALLSWQGDDRDSEGGLLGIATGAYGDAGDPERERWFTRATCAELLIDAGAVVRPSVCEGLLQSRARGLLQLFQHKGLLPRTLEFQAALGDINAVRTTLDENGNAPALVNEAFVCACRFDREAVASLLLERSIALDRELGAQIDESVGRHAFVSYFIANRPGHATTAGLWKGFVMEQVSRTVSSWNGHSTSVTPPVGDSDLAAFVRSLQRERWLLGEASVEFQAEIIEKATLKDRGEFITALFALDPAILRRQPPPPSQAIEFAFTYVRTHLLPLLTRIWPLPDDLPHAAGLGNLPRVKQWFDESRARTEQRVLDVAFAWSVMNSHFDVADLLLDHGADINTTWSSHEPASILHELVFHANYGAMRFLIDRGTDMTIKDHRWNATAQGWARHAANDEKMAQWLEEAERQREQERS